MAWRGAARQAWVWSGEAGMMARSGREWLGEFWSGQPRRGMVRQGLVWQGEARTKFYAHNSQSSRARAEDGMSSNRFWKVPGRHTEDEWQSLLQVWGWRCFYCANPVRLRHEGIFLPPEYEATKDHLVPISRGGEDFIENIVPACLRCNCMKGRKTAEEFLRDRPAFSTFLRENSEKSTGSIYLEEKEFPAPEVSEASLKSEIESISRLEYATAKREREHVSWCWRNPA